MTLKLTARMTHEAYEHKTDTGKSWKEEFAIFRKKTGFRYVGPADIKDAYVHQWINDKNEYLKAVYLRKGDAVIYIEIIYECNELPVWYQQFLTLLYSAPANITTKFDESHNVPKIQSFKINTKANSLTETTKCSVCKELAVVLFGFIERKKRDIPLCYVHLRDVRMGTIQLTQ